jgi:hypothetical protein
MFLLWFLLALAIVNENPDKKALFGNSRRVFWMALNAGKVGGLTNTRHYKIV